MIRRSGASLATAGLAIIIALTLLPARGNLPFSASPNWCIWCGDAGTTNLILNVMLFVPLGAGLAWLGWRKPPAVVCGLGLSVLIEILQLTIVPGRFAALGDVLANTLGTWVGYRLAEGLVSRAAPSRTAYRARGMLAWLAAVLVPAIGAVAFQPDPGPGIAPWYGQWANVLRGLDPFGGRILDVRLDGIAVPMGRLGNAEQLRERWTRQPLRFEARVRTGPVPRRRALVATIAEPRVGWPAAIWQDGEDATMSLRTRASDFGLRSPAIRLAGAFDQTEGTELLLSVAVRGGVLSARADAGNTNRETSIRLRPALAWITIWPWSTAFREEPAGRTAAWLVGFGCFTSVLLGFWMRSGQWLWFGVLLGLTVPVLTHGVFPRLAELPEGTIADWGLTSLATGIGFLAGSVISARRKPR
jgi:hypothetical protein